MCGCRGAQSTPQQSSQQYEVRLPNGDTLVVDSEHEAKVAITRAGGGTFSRR
jgi:hypothetical protein